MLLNNYSELKFNLKDLVLTFIKPVESDLNKLIKHLKYFFKMIFIKSGCYCDYLLVDNFSSKEDRHFIKSLGVFENIYTEELFYNFLKWIKIEPLLSSFITIAEKKDIIFEDKNLIEIIPFRVEKLKMSKTISNLLLKNEQISFNLNELTRKFMEIYIPNNKIDISKLSLELKNYFKIIFIDNDDKGYLDDYKKIIKFLDFLRPFDKIQERILFCNFIEWLNIEQLLELFHKMIRQEISKLVCNEQKIDEYLGIK